MNKRMNNSIFVSVGILLCLNICIFGFVVGVCYIAIKNQKDIIKIIENQNAIIENQGEIISLQSSMAESTLRVERELYRVSALTFEFYGFPADKKQNKKGN